MKRKLSRTTHTGNRRWTNGQFGSKFICFNCKKESKGFSKCELCKSNNIFEVPATAQIPKKTASNKQWKLFYDKFVLKKEQEKFEENKKNKLKIKNKKFNLNIGYKLNDKL